MRAGLATGFFFVLAVSAWPVHADGASSRRTQTPPILAKAITAADRLRFAGERVVEFQQGPNRKVHVEYVLHDGLNTRVWFPRDSVFRGQVIVETAQERLHYFPGRNEIEVLAPKREEAYLRLKRWLQRPGRIRLSAVHGDAIAGRQTELAVVADEKGNVMQRLWIDSQNGMVLKREVLDKVGARVGFFQYQQVDYNPIVRPGDFQINVRGAIRVSLEGKARRLAARGRFQELLIPPGNGFQLDAVNIIRPNGSPVLHQTYLGPRGKLSLFQVSAAVNMQGLTRATQRDLQFYGWQANGRSFAFVGGYPLERLKELARLLGDSRNGP
jgi:hypothetical protein